MVYVVGALLNITYNENDGEYDVVQKIEDTGHLRLFVCPDRRKINNEFGIAKTTGYLDLDTYHAENEVSIAGLLLGPFYCDMEEENIVINVKLQTITGHITYRMNEEKEFWVEYKLKTTFGVSWEQEILLCTATK